MTDCPSCGGPLGAKARFCGACGFKRDQDDRNAPNGSPPGGIRRARSSGSSRPKARRRRASRGGLQRTVLGIATSYVGVLMLLVFFPWELEDPGDPTAEFLLGAIFSCVMVLLGFLAAAILGKGALADSFADRASGRFLGIGAAAGVAILVVNVTLLALLSVLLGGTAWEGFAVPDSWVLALLGTAVLPALTEEWLCRGVLWTGLKRIASERGTLVLSSILFAMLHGLGEARLMELPTRFLAGLALGFLRSKSDSLQPGIAAHFVNNALACFLA